MLRDCVHDRRSHGGSGADETETEQADRRYNELLQELRVAQTGVQFLFAFLPMHRILQRRGLKPSLVVAADVMVRAG